MILTIRLTVEPHLPQSTPISPPNNHFFLISEMIIPGSSYWNFGVGRNIGEVEGDEEWMKTMAALRKNMAWLLKRIKE